MAVRTRGARAGARWVRFDDERLLDLRFCDLGLRLEGSWLDERMREVWAELGARGLRLKPHVWLSTEWFSPDGVPGIALPFYLAHPRLTRLERSRMLEVEGGSRDECLAILRHEAGHCMQHAWRLHRREAWRRLFGDSARDYPEIYRPNPASQRFVQHLRQYYAQAHPDEDFAETFAVWLAPRSGWRRRYADWPALRKLEYVDELMRSLREQVPPVRSRRQVEPLAQVRRTLREHYAAKQASYARWRPSVQDRDLQRLFAAEPGRRGEPAERFLRRNRAEIRRLVSRFTGESAFTLERTLDDVIARCGALDLRASGHERRLRVDFALLLAVRTVHFHYSRRNWVAL
ncbi:MAG TPA: putative zinc-binding metallopeptidase [Candidatus Acidoferrales bacterium]|nr:putative zinc-binding metallopeptidase [Candidatus Acidoferrales bacterium]